MNNSRGARIATLMRREMQEYRNPLLWTPLVIAGVLTALMLFSVLFANRLTVVGDTVLDALSGNDDGPGLSIRILIDDDQQDGQDFRVESLEQPLAESDWEFSRDWTFRPPADGDGQAQAGDDDRAARQPGVLNPVLHGLHNMMLLVLFLVTFYYLLGSLYSDRKDRSILFWKSMPVSEWEEVLAKLGVATLVAPAIYIGVSLLMQLVNSGLAMLVLYRMDRDPVELVLGNLDVAALVFNQVSGWVLTLLWLAPLYAWLMLASAGARRSPLLLAIAPVLALVVIERLFLGTALVGDAVGRHLPHANEETGTVVAFYTGAPNWLGQDYAGLAFGLLFAAAALWAAVWLRRNRFEI